eukprot:484082-Lingulodinium_polyedra.AAC.1
MGMLLRRPPQGAHCEGPFSATLAEEHGCGAWPLWRRAGCLAGQTAATAGNVVTEKTRTGDKHA